MTEQEKADLIAECRRTINAGTQLRSTYREISLAKIARIALASLTAQPVKLPNCADDLHGVGSVMSADEVIAAIRAAGYEVEE